MRISVVVPGYAREPVGGISVVYQLANRLVGRGHRVTVVHVARFRKWPSVGGGRPRRQLEEIVSGWRDQRAGVPASVHWLEVDPRVELRYVPTVTPDAVPDGDVVIATAWQTVDPVLALPPSKGRPVSLIQGLEVWSGSEARIDVTWRRPVRKVFIARWLYARAETMGLDDIHHIVLAIDTDKFRLVRPMENRPRRVAMLAGQDPGKGLVDGVAALTKARASVPDLRAVLFGVAPRPADLPAWIDYLRDPPQADLVEDVYNGSAVYLCPSHSEGWHLPAAEAMACGAAVVSTDIGGVADFARAEDTALLSPVRDPDGLARNLVRLFTDDRLRLRIARAGHDEIARHTWARSVAAFEDILSAPQPAPKRTAGVG
jgi:glycosyltransferase involved in cell wall biosynthesis